MYRYQYHILYIYNVEDAVGTCARAGCTSHMGVATVICTSVFAKTRAYTFSFEHQPALGL